MNQTRRSLHDSFAVIRHVRHTALEKLHQSRGHMISSATLAGGYSAQLVFQMAYFLILTRMLGPETFGRFAAALAAINLISPLAGLGFGEVALVRVSQDKTRSGLWAGNSLLVTAVMGIGSTLCLTLISAAIASDKWLVWTLMFGLAISELVLVRCCTVVARVHQARQEIARTSLINVAVAALKTLIALSLYLMGNRSLATLVILLDLCLTPLLLMLVVAFAGRFDHISISWTQIVAELRLAFSFGTAVACKVVYTDLDKLLLARWSTSYVVGTYAAGYKILSLSFMPIRAILEATFPRQIEIASRNRNECIRFTSTMMILNLSVAGSIAGLIYVLAPWATLVLGNEFQDSIGVLRIGFMLPVLQAVHYTLGNYMTATGHQAVRAVLQVIVLSTYVIVGLVLIPIYSWHGAIWTSLGCETLLVVLFALSCGFFAWRQRSECEERDEPQAETAISEGLW